MLGTSPRTFIDNRKFILLVTFYLLSSSIFEWRRDWKLWSAIALLLGLASLIEFFWPESRIRPKPINISRIAMCLVATALFAGGGWRRFAIESSEGRKASRPIVIPTTLKVSPGLGGQGQTL